MNWIVFCILASLLQSGFSETNRIYKIEAKLLNLLHAFFSLVLLLPLLLFTSFPSEISFYVCAFTSGVIVSYGCIKQLDLASQFNGRVSSMYIPIEAVVSFVIWALISPLSILWLLDQPFRLIISI